MSDVKLKEKQARAYYGRGAGGGDDDEEFSSSDEETMAPSGKRANGHRHKHFHRDESSDDDDGGKSLTLTRGRLDVAQIKFREAADDGEPKPELANPWDPDHNDVHHVTLRYTLQRRRRQLSEPSEKPLTVAFEFPVDAMMPHTRHRIDEHIKRGGASMAEQDRLDDIVVVGLESISASTTTLQRVGVRSRRVAWFNTARDHASRDAFLFTLAGDPNGFGRGERRDDLYTIVDNTRMLKSTLYARYANLKPEELKKQWRSSSKGGVERHDVAVDSDLYDVIVDRQHRVRVPYDIEKQQPQKGWILDVPASVVLPILKMVRDVRTYVRTIDAREHLELELVPLGARALESFEGTVFENSLPGESAEERVARGEAYLNQIAQITFQITVHYMTRPSESKKRQAKIVAGERRRFHTEEEKELALTGGVASSQ